MQRLLRLCRSWPDQSRTARRQSGCGDPLERRDLVVADEGNMAPRLSKLDMPFGGRTARQRGSMPIRSRKRVLIAVGVSLRTSRRLLVGLLNLQQPLLGQLFETPLCCVGRPAVPLGSPLGWQLEAWSFTTEDQQHGEGWQTKIMNPPARPYIQGELQVGVAVFVSRACVRLPAAILTKERHANAMTAACHAFVGDQPTPLQAVQDLDDRCASRGRIRTVCGVQSSRPNRAVQRGAPTIKVRTRDCQDEEVRAQGADISAPDKRGQNTGALLRPRRPLNEVPPQGQEPSPSRLPVEEVQLRLEGRRNI